MFEPGDDDSCRECWLQAAVPATWTARGGKTCVVVPVQTIETWLLVLRGMEFSGEPEKTYDRRALVKRFFGSPKPPVATRVSLAPSELRRPDALDILRARPSFQRFEARLTVWP